MSEAAEVVIDIYNLSGRRVQRLALGMQPPGWYVSRESAAHWDGRNAVAEWVGSGVYFYRIQAEAFVTTHRMVVVK